MGNTIERETAAAAEARAKAAALSEFPTDAARLLAEAEVADRYVELLGALAKSRADYLKAQDDRDVAFAQAVAAWNTAGRTGDKPGRPAIDKALTDRHKTAQRAVYEFRHEWRTYGVLAGTRRGVAVANNTIMEG